MDTAIASLSEAIYILGQMQQNETTKRLIKLIAYVLQLETKKIEK
jgi:hypothetical protein